MMHLKFKATKNMMNVLIMLSFFCFSLLLIGCSQDVNSLVKKLNDEKPERRLEAASTLGKLRDSRAVEPLIAVLKKDRNAAVRARAAWALGWIENPRAVEPLIAALNDENQENLQ
jgi:HEAT repeat protein